MLGRQSQLDLPSTLSRGGQHQANVFRHARLLRRERSRLYAPSFS